METAQETRRTARLLDLIWRISSVPRQWSRRRLADHYEVNERQITRDLGILRHGLRFPIQRSGDGYYFEEEVWHPAQQLHWEPDGTLLYRVWVVITTELQRWVITMAAMWRCLRPTTCACRSWRRQARSRPWGPTVTGRNR
ncbi:MAG: hypothetical protein U0232_21665 [Thermomicrobiales bacterium]